MTSYKCTSVSLQLSCLGISCFEPCVLNLVKNQRFSSIAVYNSNIMNESNICAETWMIRYTHGKSFLVHIISLLTVNALITLVGTFLNVSEILVILRLNSIPGTTKGILLNLCIADLLALIINEPMYIVLMSFELSRVSICPLANAVSIHCLALWIVSFSVLVLASFERFLCIQRPFMYERIKDTRLATILIAMIWIIAIGMSFWSWYERHTGGLLIVFAVVCAYTGIGSATIAFLYTKIYYSAYKARQRIRAQTSSIHGTRGTRENGGRPKANMIAMIVILTLVCYAPLSLSNLLQRMKVITVGNIAINWFWSLMMLNTCVNPICFSILNKTLRRKLLQLWRKQ